MHRPIVAEMNGRLFRMLGETGGLSIPLYPDRGAPGNLRNARGSRAAEFPAELLAEPGADYVPPPPQ